MGAGTKANKTITLLAAAAGRAMLGCNVNSP